MTAAFDSERDRNIDRNAEVSTPGRTPMVSLDKLRGLITGIALGDSLGLPVESRSAADIAEKFGEIRGFLDLAHHKHLAKHNLPSGSYSDDAQLSAAMFSAYTNAGALSFEAVIEAHIAAYNSSTLGWGWGTRNGVALLCQGLRPETPQFIAQLKPGTGNGIPMKIAAVGAWCVARNLAPIDVAEHVREICSLSHPTSMSVSAGLAHIAGLRYCLTTQPHDFSSDAFISCVVDASALGTRFYPDTASFDDITQRLSTIAEVAAQGSQAIIDTYGGGKSYVYDSLPFAYAFFLTGPRDPDTLYRVIEAGGDTDSNAAFVGALQGALIGPAIFSEKLVSQVVGLSDLIACVEAFHRVATS